MVPDLAGKKEIIMKKLSSAPTMKDVAREAGVALGTVSKVINGIPVGEEYKKRVESAVKKLDYRINSYAQGMKAGRTFTAALLIPNTREPFFADLTYQINLAFLRRKYRMLHIIQHITLPIPPSDHSRSGSLSPNRFKSS